MPIHLATVAQKKSQAPCQARGDDVGNVRNWSESYQNPTSYVLVTNAAMHFLTYCVPLLSVLLVKQNLLQHYFTR